MEIFSFFFYWNLILYCELLIDQSIISFPNEKTTNTFSFFFFGLAVDLIVHFNVQAHTQCSH